MNNEIVKTDALTERINAKYREVEGLARSTVEAEIELGGMLVEKKASLGHGEWLPWVEEHFEGSERHAQNFMKLYNNRDRLLDGNPQRVADLSIRGALRELTAPAATALPDMPEGERDIIKRAQRDFAGEVSVPDLATPIEPEKRRGFVAEVAWRCMIAQCRRYLEARNLVGGIGTAHIIGAHLAVEDGRPLNEKEQTAKTAIDDAENQFKRLRWWIRQVEQIETLVRACDWPPGGGMPKAAFDEETKYLPMSELYDDDAEHGLPSPRAAVQSSLRILAGGPENGDGAL